MTTFHTLSTAIPIPGPSSFSSTNRELTPTTPRADKSFSNQGDDRNDRLGQPQVDESSLKTPTRDSFTGLAGQLPLPSSSSFPPPHHDRTEGLPPVDRGHDDGSVILKSSLTASTGAAATVARPAPRNGTLKRGDSHQSALSVGSQHDVEMGDGDDDGQDVGSDNDSDNGDSRRPSKKKKKGQRFFCTDFPPCQLSFTRSEHLARHIRKHTGERPFQCHCSRRFSRLDNLRQHAQTVHVNEDIPGDSLAATGTRFQRQIRTDRVRPPSSRSRNSTLGGGSVSHTHGHGHSHSHSHGHGRNLSSSSVDSSASAFVQSDAASRRRRPPPPLAIATDSPAQHRLSMESFGSHNASPASHHALYAGAGAGTAAGGNLVAKSPTRFGTPTSSTFSAETGSPKFSSGIHSPMTSAQQQSSTSSPSSSAWTNGTAARRLSVPSAVNPFQPPPPGSHGYPPPYLSPLASSTASAFSPNTSTFASPTSSIFSESRNDPISAAEAEWRRRTWHPGTYAGQRPATSGFAYNQRLGSPRPAFVPLRSSQAAQVPRLPGIESFDQVPPHLPSAVSSRRAPSPLRQGGAHQVSGHTHSASISTASASQYSQTHHVHRLHHQPRLTEHPNLSAWEMPLLHRGLNRLDIANNNGTSTNNSPAVAAAATATSMSSDLPYRHQHSHSYTPGMFPAPRQPSGVEPHKYDPSTSASNTPSTQFGSLLQQSPHHAASQSSSVPSEPPPTPRRIKRLGWYNGPLATSPPGSSNGLTFAPAQHGLPGLQMQMEQQQQHQLQLQPQQQQHQQTSPEGSTSSSDGIPTPSSHSIMETDPTIIHSNGSVEGSQKLNGQSNYQRDELKTATKTGLPMHPPANAFSSRNCFVRNDEARSPAVPSNGLAQEKVAHIPPHCNESSFSGSGKASTLTPSFDLGFGPGPVEYSSTSTKGADITDGSASGDTRRLDALVAVATREESDEMRS